MSFSFFRIIPDTFSIKMNGGLISSINLKYSNIKKFRSSKESPLPILEKP